MCNCWATIGLIILAMSKKRVPHHLWVYGIQWVCEVMKQTASTSGHLKAHTPLEQLTGEMPDRSEYLDFSFYDLCWYNDNAGLGETKLGHWLGVSHRIGSLMSYWILTINGNVISCTTISHVTNLELQEDLNKSNISEFDAAIKDRLNDDATSLWKEERHSHLIGQITPWRMTLIFGMNFIMLFRMKK